LGEFEKSGSLVTWQRHSCPRQLSRPFTSYSKDKGPSEYPKVPCLEPHSRYPLVLASLLV
jgi:hypothetical protein